MGFHCCEKKSLTVFCFFSAVQEKPIVNKNRWYFRCSPFIHHSSDNLPIRLLRSTRVIPFVSHVRCVRWFGRFNCFLTFNAKYFKPDFVLFLITMTFVVFKEPIFPIKHSFNDLVIQGGSRGKNLLVSFGMKFDLMFKKFSVNVLACQLGSIL